jgi:hypothetical protein
MKFLFIAHPFIHKILSSKVFLDESSSIGIQMYFKKWITSSTIFFVNNTPWTKLFSFWNIMKVHLMDSFYIRKKIHPIGSFHIHKNSCHCTST